MITSPSCFCLPLVVLLYRCSCGQFLKFSILSLFYLIEHRLPPDYRMKIIFCAQTSVNRLFYCVTDNIFASVIFSLPLSIPPATYIIMYTWAALSIFEVSDCLGSKLGAPIQFHVFFYNQILQFILNFSLLLDLFGYEMNSALLLPFMSEYSSINIHFKIQLYILVLSISYG